MPLTLPLQGTTMTVNIRLSIPTVDSRQSADLKILITVPTSYVETQEICASWLALATPPSNPNEEERATWEANAETRQADMDSKFLTIKSLISGWDDIVDHGNSPISFSADRLDRLIDIQPNFRKVFVAHLKDHFDRIGLMNAGAA